MSELIRAVDERPWAALAVSVYLLVFVGGLARAVKDVVVAYHAARATRAQVAGSYRVPVVTK